MQYFGGKSRIAKKLGAELQSRLKPNQTFVDLFCGSCNIVSNVKAEIRIANDIHPQLMAMHKAVQNGWIPPEVVTEEDYRLAKTSGEDHVKGFVGFGCSFGGKYFGGYARGDSSRNYASNAKRALLEKHSRMCSVDFHCASYEEVHLGHESLVYCDIPYQSSTSYSNGKFDHEKFYRWAKNAKVVGHTVLISEYAQNVPDGFEIVWQVQSKKDIRNKDGIRLETVEVLMQPRC